MSNQLLLSRRQFMVGCSAAIAAMAGSRISQMAIAAPSGPDANTYESVIVVFLRGGMDGINAVLPIGGVDRGNYETWRPTLKVPVSGGLNGNAINLGTANTLNGTRFDYIPVWRLSKSCMTLARSPSCMQLAWSMTPAATSTPCSSWRPARLAQRPPALAGSRAT